MVAGYLVGKTHVLKEKLFERRKKISLEILDHQDINKILKYDNIVDKLIDYDKRMLADPTNVKLLREFLHYEQDTKDTEEYKYGLKLDNLSRSYFVTQKADDLVDELITVYYLELDYVKANHVLDKVDKEIHAIRKTLPKNIGARLRALYNDMIIIINESNENILPSAKYIKRKDISLVNASSLEIDVNLETPTIMKEEELSHYEQMIIQEAGLDNLF